MQIKKFLLKQLDEFMSCLEDVNDINTFGGYSRIVYGSVENKHKFRENNKVEK